MAHKLVPHLWFDKEAKQAAEFYASVFDDSKVTNSMVLPGTPSGDAEVVMFEVRGMPFQAISAGPYFKVNPSISFMVNFDPSREANAAQMIDEVWEKLIEGGKALMNIGEYPFSKRYGWVEDKFGVSWQLILTNPKGEERPTVIPSMLFVNDKYGKAEEAITFYLSVFKDSKLGTMAKYPADMGPNKKDTVMFSDFRLFDTWLSAMDGGGEHKFNFNEGVSIIVNCDTQEEIDYYSDKLSSVPEAEQCGWLKDKFGVSWQIVPKTMDEMMFKGTPEQIKRLTKAFLPMKRFDIAKLQKAYEEK